MAMATATATDTLTAMDSAALYRLMSWMSPAYPVGAFSYSHGLEAALDAGRVTDAPSLEAYIRSALRHGVGRVDGALFRASFEAAQDRDADGLRHVAAIGFALAPSAELALESRAQGRAFLKTTQDVWPQDLLETLPEKTVYPVAVGAAAALHGIDLEPAAEAYFHGFVSTVSSAGVRLIPLGQTDGQRIVAALADDVGEAAARAPVSTLDDAGSAVPMIDILSAMHETQHTRLFRS